MRKVLVTGARGFIGSRCLGLLQARDFDVHAVSSSTAVDVGGRAAWHRCNLLDEAACDALVERIRPSHLLHLAWIAQPGVFWDSPANRDWLAAGARLARRFYALGGQRAVAAGSCAEYGPSSTPCNEDTTPIAPVSAYGQAKTTMHAALREAAGESGSWAWARLFFPYGPGEPAGRFIPSLVDGLLHAQAIDCTHGRQVRDFIYVEDVAEACVALLDSQCAGAYNVGTGQGRSLREIAALIVSELGHADLVRFGARTPPEHDLPYVVSDNAKIGVELGWSPRIGLREGIERTIAARRASVNGAS
jgi:nucleoside-diphosphate-sugar epimerase